MEEFHSFSVIDYICRRKGADVRLCHAALIAIVAMLLPPTLFVPDNFNKNPWIGNIETQIARGDTVRKSKLLPAFARVNYLDPEPNNSFERFCQIQSGMAPIFLLFDNSQEYALLNARERPNHLPEGYRLVRDFGHGLLLLRKV